MNIFYFITQQAMLFSIPLLIVALAGLFSERSGVSNIALEGLMIVGAFTGTILIQLLQNTMSGQLLLLIVLLAGGIMGVIFALLLAFSAINMKANQIIGGTAINLIAPALTILLARTIQTSGVQQVRFTNTFLVSKVPLLGDIPIIGPMFFQNAYITTYIGIGLLIVASIVLYRTRFGLRLRACGENPNAVAVVGVNVYRYRYAGVIISGFLAGMGGVIFVVPTSTSFNHSVAGYGFLALAVLILGQWRPMMILGASFLFGLLKTLSSSYSAIPFLSALSIPAEFYKIIPFVATLIVLSFTSRRSQAPKAVGEPYDRGAR